MHKNTETSFSSVAPARRNRYGANSSKGDLTLKINQHHYIERDTGQVCSERPIGDWIVNYLYSKKREDVPFVYQLLGSQWFSGFLGWVNYDFPLGQSISGIRRFLKNCAFRC